MLDTLKLGQSSMNPCRFFVDRDFDFIVGDRLSKMNYQDYSEKIRRLEEKLDGYLPQAERERIAQQIRLLEARADRDGLE